jgi:hypothetical protein
MTDNSRRTGTISLTICAAWVLLTSAISRSPLPHGEQAPRIVLERAERAGFWRATYELTEPADHLTFQRPAAYYRESVREVVTPGWSLERSGDRQTLQAEPGHAATTIVVEFPIHTAVPAKEYEFFQRFSDGSLAIYTGHLYLAPSTPDAEVEADDQLRRIEFVPAPGEPLLVQGELFQERTVWDDPHGDGTYAYFGAIEPVETDEMVAIVDPGAPGWLTEQMQQVLPRMFSLYTKSFGEPLPWKPVVLFNFDGVDTQGRSSGGGTLTGLVQMSASGRGWHEATPEASEQLLYLIAHEAAHLWNGQLHHYADAADIWMHEGSADAFADAASWER